MKRKEFLGNIMMGSLGLVGASSFAGDFMKNVQKPDKNKTRRRMLFDRDWRFHLGDVNEAQKPGFNDHSWRKLTVPHDWSIEGEFSTKYDTTDSEGDLPGGIGWYRKSFTVPESKKSKRFFIEFYGVYEDSDVYLNGHHLGNRPYGYSTFRYDMTLYLNYGSKKNELAVKVDNSKQPNSRWYSGSGITRHVWMIETNPVHVGQWGTFVSTPFIDRAFASISIKTTINNKHSKHSGDKNLTLKTAIHNPDGKRVAEDSQKKTIQGGSSSEISQNLKVKNPTLWSVEDPELYKVV